MEIRERFPFIFVAYNSSKRNAEGRKNNGRLKGRKYRISSMANNHGTPFRRGYPLKRGEKRDNRRAKSLVAALPDKYSGRDAGAWPDFDPPSELMEVLSKLTRLTLVSRRTVAIVRAKLGFEV